MRVKIRLIIIVLALLAGIQPVGAQNWDDWHPLGNRVSVSFAQVPGTTTWTWRFQNNGTAAITYMDFYVTDSTGQNTDVFPGTLAPGAILGGWAAFTAVSPPTILIKTIQWANATGDASPTTSAATTQQLAQQQAAQQAQQRQEAQQQQRALAAQQQQQIQALQQQQNQALQQKRQQIVNNAYSRVAANSAAGANINNTLNQLGKQLANDFQQQDAERQRKQEQEDNDEQLQEFKQQQQEEMEQLKEQQRQELQQAKQNNYQTPQQYYQPKQQAQQPNQQQYTAAVPVVHPVLDNMAGLLGDGSPLAQSTAANGAGFGSMASLLDDSRTTTNAAAANAKPNSQAPAAMSGNTSSPIIGNMSDLLK